METLHRGGCTPFGPRSESAVSSLRGHLNVTHQPLERHTSQEGGLVPITPFLQMDKAEVQEGRPQVPLYMLDVEAQAAVWEGPGLL